MTFILYNSEGVHMCLCVCVCIYVHVLVCIYVHVYKERILTEGCQSLPDPRVRASPTSQQHELERSFHVR